MGWRCVRAGNWIVLRIRTSPFGTLVSNKFDDYRLQHKEQSRNMEHSNKYLKASFGAYDFAGTVNNLQVTFTIKRDTIHNKVTIRCVVQFLDSPIVANHCWLAMRLEPPLYAHWIICLSRRISKKTNSRQQFIRVWRWSQNFSIK